MAASVDELFRQAIECFRGGQLDDAERHFRALLDQQPNHVAALNILGILLASMQKFSDAEPVLQSALKLNSSSDVTFYNYGIVLKGLGRPAEALQQFDKALAINPAVAETWNNRGTVQNDLERYEAAVSDFDRALSLAPDNPAALCNKAKSLGQLDRHDEALAAYQRAIELNPGQPDTWIASGDVLGKLRRHDEAVAAFARASALKPDHIGAQLGRGNASYQAMRYADAAEAYKAVLALDPKHAPAWVGYGNALTGLESYDEALDAFDKVLAQQPSFASAWVGRGNALLGQKRPQDALAAHDRALTLQPDLPEAWLGRGNSLYVMTRHVEALAAYDKAMATAPDLAAAWLGRGNAFAELGQGAPRGHEEAVACYDRALALIPGFAEAWRGLGNVFTKQRFYDKAAAAYDRAYELKPNLDFVAGPRLHAKQHICDWSDLERGWNDALSAIRNGKLASIPFVLLGGPSTTADQLQCARLYSADTCPPAGEQFWKGERYAHERIRVAYLSADFREHPISHLLASLFEQHDRSRFETIAIALGPDDQSAMRTRLKGAFERFIDVDSNSDRDVARLIRDKEVDIVVDLMGFTSGCRPGILGFRPAPIHVNYLSYPGITGSGLIDYVLADRCVIPEGELAMHSEAVAYLPDVYMAYDVKQKISHPAPTRAELGLPDAAFVFCAYNNSFKIAPDIFDIWMRLLNEVPGSVLLMARTNATAASNLRREAKSRGIDPDRLHFALYVADPADHLARYRTADLFLDTLPFNAQTTACDALWAGLPVLTCLGTSFVGRVAASLLSAVGLPEMITHSLEDYEALALKLARDPSMLAEIKARLARNLEIYPLFNIVRFTRHVEAAFMQMWERYQRGEGPAGFAVEPRDVTEGLGRHGSEVGGAR
jgi:predicted O-linked N-acetylglucosamine transferase (SPINDLY family)